MKKFLNEMLKFGVFLILGTIILIMGTLLIERNIINFTIPANKTVLVVGDSHTACAVNDEILTNVFNFSKGGSGYFYTFLKVRKMLEDNPQITTLVIGYSYGNLEKSRDEWFKGEKYITGNLNRHLFLLDFSDFYSIFISNPYHVLISTISERIASLYSDHSLNRWGKYKYLEQNELEESKARLISNDKTEKVEYSEYQEKYLLKLYHLAMAKDINVILLNAPIHPMFEESQEAYKGYYNLLAEHEMPNATIINHSNMNIPESGFGDIRHLNFKGAEIYSEYLKANNLLQP